MREAIVGTAVGGPYSPAVIAEGKFVFVAGQGPLRDGVYNPGPIADETRLTLENMGALLEQAGSGFEHVVRCGRLARRPGRLHRHERRLPHVLPGAATRARHGPRRPGRREDRDRLHRRRPDIASR